MDSISELRMKLSDLHTADGAESSSSAGGSSKNAMDGEGQRVSDEGPKDLPAKASEDDFEQLAAPDVTELLFLNDSDSNIQLGTSKITGWYEGVTFEDCLLDNSTITNCRMTNVTFRGCTFADTTWAELHLEDVDFEGCVFKEHLWRCRSLHGKRIKGNFLKETSLGGDIPLETDTAFWVKKQQYAFIAASEGGDEALASRRRYFSAEGDASIEWVPDAKTCESKRFQEEDAARRARWVPSPLNSWG
ncbi:hypothetical protein KC331_g2505 [Hortaea werneckii]|nr:hypothetical protein KC331_g2505 [Hortaea werneckii]KAI7718375.1 hypothetical protein KC353_g3843 [Hortaea werneckii]